MRRLILLVGSLAILAACGDDGEPPADSSVDTGVADTGVDADTGPPIPEPAAPIAPTFVPCPDGYRETTPADGQTVCAAWPETGPAECGPREMQLPGEAACRRVGPPCPVDGFPTDLPAGSTVVYVAAGSAGGDGTRAAPVRTIRRALSMAADDAIIAIASGVYPETLRIEQDVTLWGGCTDAVVDGGGGMAITVSDAVVTLRNLSVDNSSQGIWAFNGGRIVGRSLVITRTGTAAISFGSGASMDLEEILVRDARDVALDSGMGTELAARRVVVENTADGLLRASGGTLTLEDAVARDVATTGSARTLLIATTGSTVTIERASLEGLGDESILIVGSEATFRDVVADYDPDRPVAGTGLLVTEGSHVLLERVRLLGPGFQGVGAGDPGTEVTLRDVVIRDVVPSPLIMRGQGIEVSSGAIGTLERVLVAGVNGVGILISGRTTMATLSDVSVRDTTPLSSGTFGRALQVQLGAAATVTRLAVSGNHEASVVGASNGTTLVLEDVRIDDTRDRTCVDRGCDRSGIGLGSYLNATVEARSFRITTSALAGVQLATDGEMDLYDGEVSGGPIGANVQVDGYDFDRLSNRVAYRDNGVNLDATELPVPDPVTSVGAP